MGNIKFMVFFLVFTIVVLLFRVLVLNTPLSFNIIIWAIVSGIISTGLVYLIQEKKKKIAQ